MPDGIPSLADKAASPSLSLRAEEKLLDKVILRAYTFVICMKIISMNTSVRPRSQAAKPASIAASPEPGLRMLTLENAAPAVRRVPLALARRFFQICTVTAAQSLAETDLTPLEFAVMAYINKAVGEPGIDQTALAARIGIDRNNTSLLVSQLVAKGLLETRISANDRRTRLLWLTPRGEKLHARLYPLAGADQLRILDAALEPAEREMLLDLLVRVIQSNRQLARPGAGRRKRGSVSGTTATN